MPTSTGQPAAELAKALAASRFRELGVAGAPIKRGRRQRRATGESVAIAASDDRNRCVSPFNHVGGLFFDSADQQSTRFALGATNTSLTPIGGALPQRRRTSADALTTA